jgi:hypothetical protein
MTFEELKIALAACPAKPDGVGASDLELLPGPVQSILRRMLRQGSMKLSEFQSLSGLALDEARAVVGTLIEKGFVEKVAADPEAADPVHRLNIARKRGGTAPLKIWEALEK